MNSNHTILLVEDNEDDVFIMKRALKSAGIINPLFTVENGQLAVDYLGGNGAFADRERHPLPSVIFLDLKLPLMSGHQVLEWIREREDYSSVVVVVLTSSEEPADVKKAYELGANSYLVKPPSSAQLVEISKAFKEYWIDQNQFARP